ncbi:peptidoglycan-binding domain-containing protein [Streptomyces sp. MJP52]|uniref:peptidoglycan-binding domain-containing protein n=1 Tax=Streptomyces sp. MJP52 TaxID=2940555 RepID=UPI00247687B8|nr:peptidoglycan-binding domain-containing protein [Streptomyces sp. MJP52]MDH6227169.1 hypothetical protein [Streptomyces sp. MJP52]
MNENQGNECPGCGAPRQADHTSSCACALLAAEALRDAREREAAEAEDFDPLRVRPYVGLTPPGDEAAAGGEPRVIVGEVVAARDAAVPLAGPLPPERPAPAGAAGPARAHPGTGAEPEAPDGRAHHGRGSQDGPDGPVLPAPGPSAHGPGTEGGAAGGDPGTPDDGPRGTHRRRRTPKRRVALVTAGSVVGVGAVIAGVTGGLFAYQTPSRTTSMPQRVSVPDVDPEVAADTATEPSTVTSAPPQRSASPEPSPSATASASASASAEASRTATPEAERSSASATQSADGAEGGTGLGDGSLAPGDTGPEVAELQRRLAELWLYSGDADGRYDDQVRNGVSAFQYINGIQDDEYGTYGPATRAVLESITRGDGRHDGGHDGRWDGDRHGDGWR